MTEYKPKYEKWGNNEFHNPEFCKDCELDCALCSNGPRGVEYRRAEARLRIEEEEAIRIAQYWGRLG